MRINFTHSLAAAALSIAVSGCASGAGGGMAQNHSGMTHGENMMMSMGPMVGCRGPEGSADVRLAGLRSALRITSAQEALWTSYAEVYRRNASSMGMASMGSSGRQTPASAPVPERLQRHETMMSMRLASLHDLRTALAPLYESLSAEQKMVADAMTCDRPMQ